MTEQARGDELVRAATTATNGTGEQPAPEQAANGYATLYAVEAELRSEDPRDRLASQRDQQARERDELSAQRDHEAALRDQEELELDGREALCDRHTLRVEELRARAAMGRRRAADYRRRAARDRQLAARDREQAARDREHAGTDELTGVRRRGVGLEELRREIERARRTGGSLVLAFIDVDHLKAVNDEHGHLAGDQLLRDVASGLVGRMRSYDLVVRIGGDEFLCALPDVTLTEARRRFDELASELRDAPTPRSVSFGLSELGRRDSLQNLIDRADRDLMAARGRRRTSGRGEARLAASDRLLA